MLENFEKIISENLKKEDAPPEITLPKELVEGMAESWRKSFPSKQSSHLPLAPSQDWLALGKAKLATKDVEGAIACAQAGLEELGSAYLVPLIRDDTEIKLLLAEERLQEGHLEDGVQMMLRILESRLLLYAALRKTLGMEEAVWR